MNKDEKILECRIEDQQSGTESRIPEGSVDDHIRIGEGDGQAECRIPKEEGDIRIGEEQDVQGRLTQVNKNSFFLCTFLSEYFFHF